MSSEGGQRGYLCPRDGHALRPVRDLFECPECRGMLARGSDVGDLHPILSRIEASRAEALSSPEHGTGVSACAECRSRTNALSFFEVPIDWCSRCGAIWLDGGELDQLRTQVERLKDLVTNKQLDPYRTSAAIAAQLVVLGQVTCTACFRTVSVKQSIYTSEGLVCVPCGREKSGELPSEETEAEVNAWLDQQRRANAMGPHAGDSALRWFSRLLGIE